MPGQTGRRFGREGFGPWLEHKHNRANLNIQLFQMIFFIVIILTLISKYFGGWNAISKLLSFNDLKLYVKVQQHSNNLEIPQVSMNRNA